jgi:hypothetical protein
LRVSLSFWRLCTPSLSMPGERLVELLRHPQNIVRHGDGATGWPGSISLRQTAIETEQRQKMRARRPRRTVATLPAGLCQQRLLSGFRAFASVTIALNSSEELRNCTLPASASPWRPQLSGRSCR